VKTTIEIADDLADKARQLAAARGITFRAVIEEGLRLTLRDAAYQGRGA
jgi:predicted transcriptional regulator